MLGSSDFIVFGGINENNQKFNELYNFDFNDKRWTILFPSGEYPAPRTYHNMIFTKQKIFVFGGYSNTTLNDCYALTLTENNFDFTQKHEKEFTGDFQIEEDLTERDIITTDDSCFEFSNNNSNNVFTNTIFLNYENKNEDPDFIENNVDKALGIKNKNYFKLKESLFVFAYKDEIKLLGNQVNELKTKIENEVNKNSCKVNLK